MAELTDQQIEELLQKAESRYGEQPLTFDTSSSKPAQQRNPLNQSTLPKPLVKREGNVARYSSSNATSQSAGQNAGHVRKVEDPIAVKKQKAEERKASAGSKWFNLPRTKVTPELTRDLQLMRMRSVLDPKRHFKKDNNSPLIPEYSQIGTIEEGPTDFYSNRLTRAERKKTLVEEVLAGEHERGQFRKKFSQIQATKRSGKKGEYRARMAKRYGKKFNG